MLDELNKQPTGAVRTDELLTLRELRRRLGWGADALRTARVRGLPIIKLGKSKFVLGSDVIAFFATLAREQNT